MAPFIDPGINDLIRDYYTSGCDTKFLYGGSQEHIIVELHAWILRREEIIRTQHEMHVKMVDIPLKFNKSSPETPQERATWAEGLRDMEYCKALDDEYWEDNARATYLLRTLNHRGIYWPRLWWRPNHDGGVCSFLGTVDPSFDPDMTLFTLQNLEGMQLLKAKMWQFQSLMKKRAEEEARSLHGSAERVGKDIETTPPAEKKEMMGKPLSPASAANPAKEPADVNGGSGGGHS